MKRPSRKTAYHSRCWMSALALAASFSISGCAAPLPPKPVVLEFDQQAIRKQLESERAVAVEQVSKSPTSVTRTFYVGLERHHGFFLVATDDPNGWIAREWIRPDFQDRQALAPFDEFFRDENLAKAVGKKIACECVGVEWTFHSQPRFLVRSAKLTIVPAD